MPKFIVDRIEFNSEDLTDEGKLKLESMQFLEGQIYKLNKEIDIFKVASAVLLSQLNQEITENEINAIVGASIPLAVGAALTAKYKGDETNSIGVSFFGDGATSQGILHESMNLASVWKLPVIFACENNGYAEATPAWYAVSTEDIASRAEGYGMPGIIVDGMDVFEVYDAAGEAVKRARAGEGPTLIEMKTYRYHGHFHADDPKKYRTDEEEKLFHEKDPIINFETRVTDQKLITKAELDSIKSKIEKEMTDAVEFALNSPMPDINDLYKDVYVEYSNPIEGLR